MQQKQLEDNITDLKKEIQMLENLTWLISKILENLDFFVSDILDLNDFIQCYKL